MFNVNKSVKDEKDEPMDKYVDEVKDTMSKYKTGLASDTNVENMVSCVTNKVLQKFTAVET